MAEQKDLLIAVKAKDESAKEFAKAERGVEKLNSKIKGFSSSLGSFSKKMRGYGKTLSTFGTLPMVAFGVASVKAFNEQAIAEKRLEQIATQVTGATKEQIESFKKLAAELQQVGVVGDEVIISGQSQLASFTKNAEVVETLSGSLADLAVAQYGTNVTGDQAIQTANLMGKALQGQLGALTRTGILVSGDFKTAFEEANTEQERATVLAGIIQDNYGGVNKAMKETAAGGMQALKNSTGDLMEQFGELISDYLLPVVNKLSELVTWFGGLSEGTKKTIIVVGALIAVLGPLLIILGAMATALNAIVVALGILLSPIGLVIAAIVALGVAGFLMWKKWDTIKDDLKITWELIKAMFLTGADFVGEQIERIVAGFKKMIDWAKQAWEWIKKVSSESTVGKAVSSVGGFISGARASGGLVGSGRTYLVGERGPELFTPNTSGNIIPNSKLGSDKTLQINITGNTLLDRRAGEKIGDQIIRQLKLSNAL